MRHARPALPWLAVIGMLSMPLATLAADIDFAMVEPQEHRTMFRISGGYEHRFETDLDDGGEFEMDSFRVALGTETDLTENLTWDNYLPYDFNSYDFSPKGAYTWEDIHTFGLISLLKYSLDRQKHVYAGGVFRLAAEDGADFGDAVGGGGIAGFLYVHSPRLIYGFGLGVLSQLEDDTVVMPFPTLDWRFGEGWKLAAGFSELAASFGLGLELSRQLGEAWNLAGGVLLQGHRFRLDDKGPNPDGVGEVSSVPLYAQLTWSPRPAVQIEAVAGGAMAGEMRVEDKRGRKIGDDDYDPSLMLGLRMLLRF